MRLPSRPEALAGLWTLGATVLCRRRLTRRGVEAVALPSARRIPANGEAGVQAVLERMGATCLVSSCVLQAWHADHGRALELVIGVTAPAGGFSAHAWLEEPGAGGAAPHTEMLRLAPPDRLGRGHEILHRLNDRGELLPAKGSAQPVGGQAGQLEEGRRVPRQ